ncbi:MAG: patatin-like phospholipase family protein [Heyndrickxia sp.]
MEIDGVFSGGGIKGLALIGAYEELETKGFTFKRIAGTSAGSIIAALVAAGYTAEELRRLSAEVDFPQFLDPRKTWLPLPFAKWLFLYWRLGLYRGKKFEDWLTMKLAEKGVYTFADLPKEKLRVVASDLTNGRLLVLPDNLVDLGVPIDSFPVAKAIRMSCSIPYFFEPVKLRSLDGINIIVDGAVLSNFPMWLFVNDGEKKVRPVVGISLSSKLKDHRKHTIKNGFQLFGALFDTMKDAHDTKYISRQIEKDIIFIPTDTFTSIEFDLVAEKKDALIELGRLRTKEFLKKWSY